MRHRLTDPPLIFLMAIYAFAFSIFPEKLRPPILWLLFLALLMVIPWPGYKSIAPGKAWAETKSAERFFVALLGTIWLLGIFGSATLKEFGPELLREQMALEFNKVTADNINITPEQHVMITPDNPPKSGLYIASPKDNRVHFVPAQVVMRSCIADLINILEQVSKIALVFGFIIASAMLYVLGHVYLQKGGEV